MKNDSTHPDLLRDVYASPVLVEMAKRAGFLAEPAVINLSTDEEFYTLSVIHMWLIENKKLYVHISNQPHNQHGSWSCDVYSTNADPEDGYCAGLQNNPCELGYHETYSQALEAGLKCAFVIVLRPG